jgi:hypothetical protein
LWWWRAHRPPACGTSKKPHQRGVQNLGYRRSLRGKPPRRYYSTTYMWVNRFLLRS